MEDIKIDFWQPETIIYGISKIFHISEESLFKLLKEYKDTNKVISNLLNKKHILQHVNYFDRVFIKCSHVTKMPDKSLLNTNGLMSLTELLKRKDSYLVKFLQNEEITINLNKNFLKYKDKKMYFSEEDNLGSKLIHDKGEIEAFYYSENEDSMIEYSCVKNYPEILCTIDNFLKDNLKVSSNLGKKWSKLAEGFDIISFYVNINDTAYINGKKKGLDELANSIELYDLDKNLFLDLKNDILFDSLWLLEFGIDCWYGNLGFDCLGIRNNYIVPYKELTIQHIDD